VPFVRPAALVMAVFLALAAFSYNIEADNFYIRYGRKSQAALLPCVRMLPNREQASMECSAS
jgi:uncharacterized membrane protein YphA (DoxX/SURF4 family)